MLSKFQFSNSKMWNLHASLLVELVYGSESVRASRTLQLIAFYLRCAAQCAMRMHSAHILHSAAREESCLISIKDQFHTSHSLFHKLAWIMYKCFRRAYAKYTVLQAPSCPYFLHPGSNSSFQTGYYQLGKDLIRVDIILWVILGRLKDYLG